jgi:hypothetical protein
LWTIGVIVYGWALGFSFGWLLGIRLDVDNTVRLIIAVVVAILAGFLFFAARKIAIMLITAFNGSVLILYGLALLIPTFDILRVGNQLSLLVVAVLGVVGFLVQFQLFGGDRADPLTEPI